jgi:hypothetical protein
MRFSEDDLRAVAGYYSGITFHPARPDRPVEPAAFVRITCGNGEIRLTQSGETYWTRGGFPHPEDVLSPPYAVSPQAIAGWLVSRALDLRRRYGFME